MFITGASSGIGKELSLAYAKLGWCVGISGRRLQLLEEVSEQAKDLSGQIFTYQLDVQDAEQCKVIAEKFIEQANGISCAIANAGIGGDDGLFSGTSSQIKSIQRSEEKQTSHSHQSYFWCLHARSEQTGHSTDFGDVNICML